ncbi:hypothetical protein Pfo_025746 [Paulownia fortunei]|nr:hypothetical protein Pfo_025746 [Paulownia fortunei]
MSDNEEVYEQFKEVKWMVWCEDVMRRRLCKVFKNCSLLAQIFQRKRLFGYVLVPFSGHLHFTYLSRECIIIVYILIH